MSNNLKTAIYSLVSLCLYIAFGGVLIHTGNVIQEKSYQPTSYVNQIVADWDELPFTSVDVTDNYYCAAGQSEIYERIWYGQGYACDCIHAYNCYDQSWCGKFQLDDKCDSNQTQHSCQQVSAFPAIRQGQIASKRICGQQGGLPFLNVTRPNTDNQCPTGYVPCSSQTSAESTVCYPEGTDLATTCPVTDLRFVSNTGVSKYTDAGYTQVAFNDSTSIVYSKDAPNLPITSTAIQNQPCMDSFYQSNSPGQTFYSTELMKFGCVKEKNTGLLYDPRFTDIGLHIDMATIYAQNGVADHLFSQPDYYNQGGASLGDLSNYKLAGWNRPTIGWSLTCEAEGKTREEGYIAAGTDLEPLANDQQFIYLGIAMVIIFSCAFCFQLVLFKKGTRITIATMIFSRFSLFIMIPIVGHDVYDSKSVTDTNIKKLNNFNVINECADQYTKVATSSIASDLSQAQDEQDFIMYWFWAVVGYMALELICIVVGVIALKCCCRSEQTREKCWKCCCCQRQTRERKHPYESDEGGQLLIRKDSSSSCSSDNSSKNKKGKVVDPEAEFVEKERQAYANQQVNHTQSVCSNQLTQSNQLAYSNAQLTQSNQFSTGMPQMPAPQQNTNYVNYNYTGGQPNNYNVGQPQVMAPDQAMVAAAPQGQALPLQP